jgi:maleylacetoacetate isomerase
MTAPFQLHSFFRSSAAWRVRIALALKGLAYETVPVNLRAGEHRAADYAAINPGLLVPALTVGDATLGQSLAIIEYLDEAHPETMPLVFGDPLERARIRAFALQIACEIHPLNNLRALKFLRSELGHDEAVVHEKWYVHWVVDGFRSLEAMAEGPRFCFGDRPSLADVTLAPQIGNATRFHVDMSQFPKLQAIGDHLDTIEAFRAAQPERQPDRSRYEPA